MYDIYFNEKYIFLRMLLYSFIISIYYIYSHGKKHSAGEAAASRLSGGKHGSTFSACLFFKFRLLLAVLTIQKVSSFSSIPPHTGFFMEDIPWVNSVKSAARKLRWATL